MSNRFPGSGLFQLYAGLRVVSEVLRRTTVYLLKDKCEYEDLGKKINTELENIDQAIRCIRISDLKAAIEHLKVAIIAIKLDPMKKYNEMIIRDLKSARNLAMLGFETVSDINEKIIATKIIIISSLILFHENESDYLTININVALKRLFDIECVQRAITDDYFQTFTFFKEKRKSLIADLKQMVLQSYLIIRHNEILAKMSPSTFDLDDLLNNPFFSPVDEKHADNKILDSEDWLKSLLKVNHLFWNKVDVPDIEKRQISGMCVVNGSDLILRTQRFGVLYCTENHEKQQWRVGWKIHDSDMLIHENSVSRYVKKLPNELFMCNVLARHCNSVCETQTLTIFKVSTGKYVTNFPWAFRSWVFVTTDERKLQFMERCSKPTPIILTYYYNTNRWEERQLDCEWEKQCLNLPIYLQHVCYLSKKKMITVFCRPPSSCSNEHPVYQIGILHKKDTWNHCTKLEFQNRVFGIELTPNGHLLVVRDDGLYLIFVSNVEKLNDKSEQKWELRNITKFQLHEIGLAKQFKVHRSGTIYVWNENQIIILTPTDQTTLYQIERITEKEIILSIEWFNDGRMVILFANGEIVVKGINNKQLI